MTATESEGVTKNLLPRIMLRSPSPSEAAPKSAALGPYMNSTRSCAYVRLGSGWPPPKSSSGVSLTTLLGAAPSASTRMGLAYAPVMACMPSKRSLKSGRDRKARSSAKSNTCPSNSAR